MVERVLGMEMRWVPVHIVAHLADEAAHAA